MKNARLVLIALSMAWCWIGHVGFHNAADAAEASVDTGPFVRISPRDHRYFELSDGRPYIPNGLNLIGPSGSTRSNTKKGLAEMELWMKSLADHGGSFERRTHAT